MGQHDAQRRLLTVGFPALEADDRAFITAFRERHDPRAAAIAPHFTFLFGCAALDEDAYTAHVKHVADSTAPIRFVCRYAMLGADDEDASAYVFLVPDEGFAALSRLHDALYRGPMAPHLRLDLPFVPHLTIGRSLDRQLMLQRCTELNASDLRIAGHLDHLAVGTSANGRFETLRHLSLSA